MRTADDLRRVLRGIDRKGYPAYKSLAGGYRFDGFSLFIDHVQGDPFAAPSSVHVEVPLEVAGFPADMLVSACTRVALADYLTRQLGAQMARVSFRVKGSGKSGLVATSRCGQEVLERSACVIDGKAITARFQVGFPAHGRTVDARGLEQILLDLVPRCVRNALVFRSLNAYEVQAVVNLAEDQASLRQQMQKAGLVAFVANGSLLPRESGASDKPLEGGVAFASPPSLERVFTLPHAGEVRGMGIPRGITLVVGGGYHGKSTLLEALQRGVYNHVRGDGREFVLADATALKLRAEDGRAVRNVDVSLFINNLPNGKDTTSFSTENASGSTSQAAAVVEGIEAGTRLLLIDEDTSATNFMVRDELMSSVIARDKEPITPFLERARGLYEQAGVSTILVAGSSGAFFAIADHVIQMDCYQPRDITEQVKSLCAERGMQVAKGSAFSFLQNQRTMPCFAEGGEGEGHSDDDACERLAQDGFRGKRDGGHRGREGHGSHDGREGHGGHDDREGRGDHDGRGGYGGRNGRGGRDVRGKRDGSTSRARDLKVRASGCDTLSVGKANVDVRYVEQLVDSEQTLALAYLLRYAFERLSGEGRTLGEAVEALLDMLDAHGWEPFCGSYVPCGLAKPRKQELFAALNRFRG